MLEKNIGYEFKNKELLYNALTHKSCSVKGSGIKNNERLEFLGDSILGFCVAEYLFNHYGSLAEGELTKVRSMVVCEKALFRTANAISLGEYIRLGKGEEHTDGRKRPSILSDAMEALFAAIFLDSDIDTVKKVIINLIEPEIKEAVKTRDYRDYKTLLQEVTQKERGASPEYVVVKEEGPDHDKKFTVQVSLHGKVLATGKAGSKKEAEKNAAKQAMSVLNKITN